MAPRDLISKAIRSATTRGEPAFVAYITAGHPSTNVFRDVVQSVASAADVIEIGVPFTDPMADGVTIQRASELALKQGVTVEWILGELAALPPTGTPIVLMSYLNPLLSFGIRELQKFASEAGVCGIIVPDLPIDESADICALLQPTGLALVHMATPITQPLRLATICSRSQGFVYAVTMTGTTGHDATVLPDVLGYLDRVRTLSEQPVCAGFGIRSRAQIELLGDHVDGVVIGSALVEALERGEDPAMFLGKLRRGT